MEEKITIWRQIDNLKDDYKKITRLYRFNDFIFKISKGKENLILEKLTATNVRLLYLFLRALLKQLELKYSNQLSINSLLIRHDGKEIFKTYDKIEITTMQELVDSVGGNIKYVIGNGREIENLSVKIKDYYIIELYSHFGFLSIIQEKKMGIR